MKKIGLIIPFLKILFTNPSVIFKSLYHSVVNENRKRYAKKKFGLSNGLPEIDLLDLFPGFEGTVDCYTHLYGTSLPIDFIILKKLAQQFDQCDYLEIGSWRGESLANLSPVCNSCTSISLADEDMKKLGWGDPFIIMQRMFSKDLRNIKHIAANSRTFNFQSLNQKFDLIFVDGDHSYEGVKHDSREVFKLLRNEKSIIVWHDCVMQFELPDWEVVAGILDGVPVEKRDHIYHLSNSLCAIYLPWKLPSKIPEFPAYPDKNFGISIKAEKLPL